MENAERLFLGLGRVTLGPEDLPITKCVRTFAGFFFGHDLSLKRCQGSAILDFGFSILD
jgi:hypothetical protein